MYIRLWLWQQLSRTSRYPAAIHEQDVWLRIRHNGGEWGWGVLVQGKAGQCRGPHGHYSWEERVLAMGSWGNRTGKAVAAQKPRNWVPKMYLLALSASRSWIKIAFSKKTGQLDINGAALERVGDIDRHQCALQTYLLNFLFNFPMNLGNMEHFL